MRKRRHRRQTRALLRAKQRVLRKRGATARQHLAEQLLSSPSGNVSAGEAFAPLASSLRTLRAEVLHHGTGPHTELIASALGDFEHSLVKLAQASTTADPASALDVLADGKSAFDRARKKARAAGSDWQL